MGAHDQHSILEHPCTGIVREVKTHTTYRYIVRVELPDGRDPWCRLAFPGVGARGIFFQVSTGDEAEVLPCFGSFDSMPIAFVGVVNGGAAPPTDWSNDRTAIYGAHVEARAAQGKAVDGVVIRPFLDDLSTLLNSIKTMGTTIASTAVPTGAGTVAGAVSTLNASDVATLVAIHTALINLGTYANTLKVLVDTSKAGQGTVPHVSPILRGQKVV